MADEGPVGAEAVRLMALAAEAPGPLVHLTDGERRAEAVTRFLADVAPDLGAVAFPPWDVLPYDRAAPSAVAMGRRMAALRRLAEGSVRVVVTSPAALLQRVPPPGAVRSFAARVEDPLDPEALAAFADAAGYRRDDRVDEPGEVAVRGEVIDVYPPAEPWPLRLEVRDGRLMALRRFDPATQLTTDEVEALTLDAATERPGARADTRWPPDADDLVTLLDHAPGARLLATPAALAARGAALAQVLEAHGDRRLHDRAPAPDRLFVDEEAWAALAAGLTLLEAEGRPVEAPALAPRPRAALAALLRGAADRRVVLVAATPRDRDAVARLARAAGAAPTSAPDWAAVRAAPPGAVMTLGARLDAGFADDGLVVLTARDLLGTRAEGEADGAVAVPWLIEAGELHVGDVVVHEGHGAARLEGLEPLGDDGGEAIRLGFDGDRTLLVPAADAGLLWRYGAGEDVALDRPDGTAWAKRQARVARALSRTAAAMVAAGAERAKREAPRLVPPEAPYARVVAGFPHEATPDQRRAERAVLGDLAAGRPMNRLLVGDVGFGKTEVALRAAAAVVLAGGQVAVVAPTTVLARQHADVFARRLTGLVDVAHLSRLVPAAEARRVREGLADGTVRLVVGTHALLAEAVAFRDLALVVVDEEQRFGAAHKRRLREMGDGCHLLAMSATPIPRSLQAALTGLQDLSLLTTPPARRRPVRTTMVEDDDATLARALTRERARGGQSFVVVPRVEDIAGVASRLSALVPRLDVLVAHGKMPARQVDEAMTAFARGQGDVLLATSLIESGLDVPAANTMIVLRPGLFGLAQLHQLRGRVGRGAAQAFCLLVTGPDAALDEATMRRLGTLQALDRLGAGMAISARDLDQRGGGDLFGEDQTGHARLIGPGLHQEMLARALREAQGLPAAEPPVEFREEAPGHLPADHIPEADVRLNLYHRLARTRDLGEVESLGREVADRFGPPPPPVVRLLTAAAIRARARGLGILRVSAGPEALALDFAPGAAPDDAAWDGGPLEWVEGRLVARRPPDDPDARAAAVLDLLEALG